MRGYTVYLSTCHLYYEVRKVYEPTNIEILAHELRFGGTVRGFVAGVHAS